MTIAQHLGISAKTVQRFLAAEAFQERGPRHFASQLDPYKVYLLQRWNQGCHNATRLAHEICLQGYPGGVTQVQEYVARLRRAQAAPCRPSTAPLPDNLAISPLTPRRVAYLLLRPPDEEDDADREFLQQFFTLFPELRLPVEQLRGFAAMVREKERENQDVGLDDWMQQLLQGDCAPLKQFVRGIQNDEAAVRAALSMTWSNGQSEGQFNRLKLIKRQMYGRAKFDLLRLRVLHPT